MKDENALSRRHFLQRLGVLGAAGVGAGAFLSACGGGEEGADMDEGGDMDEGMAGADDAFSCMDTTGLTEAELTTRQNAEYVDDSPQEDKLCNNCQFWQPDAPIDGPCGGCQVIKGPIHPEGYCNLWVAKAS